MPGWFVLASLSLLFLGGQRFLYKVSAERGCNSAWTTCIFMATVTLLSGALFLYRAQPIGDLRILFSVALLNSLSFAAATLCHMEALKHISAGVAYPVIRLNAAVVVVFAIGFFGDRPSVLQVCGIALAVFVVVLLARQDPGKGAPRGGSRRGLLFAAGALLCGAVASVSSKLAAMHTNKLAFMALSYLIGTFFTLMMVRRMQPAEKSVARRDAFVIGLAMGILNFVGFYCFLLALGSGPLSLIVSLVGMHFVIGVLLSALLYHDALTLPRITALFLTAVSVILLRG